MSREVYRSHWQDDQVVQVLVKVNRVWTPTLCGRPSRASSGNSCASHPDAPRAGELVRGAGSSRLVGLHLLGGLVLLVVLVGIGDALAASTMERTRELDCAPSVSADVWWRGRCSSRA